MGFTYDRTIHFSETDAAGVVYFANVLTLCHEAYEASLAASGISVRSFFSGQNIAVPIVHAEVDFFSPMFCGDLITIELTPHLLKPSEFEIRYQLMQDSKSVGKALTRHVCIATKTRTRIELSEQLQCWVDRFR
ncbi:1,4-dihydroxy-2-naphthoyl-CoA hydrolase [Leptolyngbya boryana NIES-2135]|jgi:1,4-dihydroxy-2-naphthoyl-CoA hydrolase|uniref:1,4-dihydroxy-2-naphthoyl-CoA hydrolase n=1 Tax=Leptolyngbya boryana NIES-2135 TaxID=1973484 RepID=A0A1Z4JPQ7_LEPBY|nr:MULTISPECIES: acyl-CoA thioesterase [Leptolyngbya]BAY58765.1 1,4-dihydroxy-2-naphthoyl-CoA hydrolase [Leptolyngbya boryana NIES-2135]MBD2370228.1 acyl-CoA thioesterase [Leptolyngbya sp. FACHB-161]MBD2376574.1 acyl-CoA thioesterase [Leptolyngbya sp. FACHB-238]MBD2400846.1 acyl-CoA thioesterase [Leptolyngbya sp. FACHB-239]MBD2407390.1 acyl-CoA thioesterase [Leptolyngbya sp. FACHB-402]